MQKARKKPRRKVRQRTQDSPFQFQFLVGIGLSCDSPGEIANSRNGSGDRKKSTPGALKPPGAVELRLDGDDPNGMLRHFRLFHEVGCQFRAGVKSFRSIARALETLDVAGKLRGMNASISALRRMRIAVEEYFETKLDLVDLFATEGIGHGFHDLTEDGWNAWRLVRDYLLKAGMIHEPLDKY
ncbi:hypothetical protein [Anatilimnocola floriformis]|uniref:hypothetical protein n=1 Tax=Anatilimnocola floriformis TaxID=2948575 RepID=UPI0020C25D66|nr:hypothetical protein [Anatilimnocola floriformis]